MAEYLRPESFKTYDLRLSYNELKTLYDVLMRVGGNPYTTRRGEADAIREAIRDTDAAFTRLGLFRDDLGRMTEIKFSEPGTFHLEDEY